MIPFNKPHLTGYELQYINDLLINGKLSGNGTYTQKCHKWFEEKYGFRKCLLTTSCTDALEMAALLIDLQPGDEVILPSYTFVSTANAFILRGAKLVFVDSRSDHPGMDEGSIESLITSKTKAIIPVHYAGVACDMEMIMEIANKYGLFVIEDAAQAIDSFFIGKDGVKRPLGSIGHLAAFSFHETKNIISGEGGMLIVNDARFAKRAEIIWEKGTNRSSFFRGEVDKYGWVDLGSSFLPSEIIAAFLYAQLENIKTIQNVRMRIWNRYLSNLQVLFHNNLIKGPYIPQYSSNNAHMFYLVTNNLHERTSLLSHLKENEIFAVFHYQSLHRSQFYLENNTMGNNKLVNSDIYTDRLVRLPLYGNLLDNEIDYITNKVIEFLK